MGRKIGVHVSLTEELVERLDAAAQRAGKARSDLMRSILETWLDREEKKAK